MKKYILVSMLFFISAYTQAQDSTKTKKPKEMERFTWEIAYNVLPLFRNGFSGGNIFIRRHKDRIKGLTVNQVAHRFKLYYDVSTEQFGGNFGRYNYQINNANVFINVNKRNYYYFHSSIGKERQHRFEQGKFMLLYGADLRIAGSSTYSNETRTGYDIDKPTVKKILGTDDNTYRKFWGGIVPFIGFKYQPHKHIAISAETNVFLNYKYETAELVYTGFDQNSMKINAITHNESSSGLDSETYGLAVIYVSFLFD